MQKHFYILLIMLFVLKTSSYAQVTNQTPREQLLKLLQNVQTTNYQASAKQIKQMGTNAIPVLIEVLGYKQQKLDAWYDQVFRSMPTTLQAHMSKPEAITALRSKAAMVLHTMPETKDYLQDLLPLLKDERLEVRQHAASVISTHSAIANPTILLEMIPLLKDSDPDVIRYAIRALSPHVLQLPRAKAAMENLLQDRNEINRMEAAQTLLMRQRNHPEALTVIRSSLNSSNISICLSAASTMLGTQRQSADLDAEVGPLFIKLLSSTNSSTQLSSLRRLYYNGRGNSLPSIIPEVQKLLTNSDPKIRMEATNTFWVLTNLPP